MEDREGTVRSPRNRSELSSCLPTWNVYQFATILVGCNLPKNSQERPFPSSPVKNRISWNGSTPTPAQDEETPSNDAQLVLVCFRIAKEPRLVNFKDLFFSSHLCCVFQSFSVGSARIAVEYFYLIVTFWIFWNRQRSVGSV